MVIVLGKDGKVTIVFGAEFGQRVYDTFAELVVSAIVVGESIFEGSTNALERFSVVLDTEVTLGWIEEVVLSVVIENRDVDSRYVWNVQSVSDQFVCGCDWIHNGCAFIFPV